jgi:hypothetical protein
MAGMAVAVIVVAMSLRIVLMVAMPVRGVSWRIVAVIVVTVPAGMFMYQYFVIGYFVQFVVHVTVGVKVNAGGDKRHHGKHQYGQSVDIIANANS